MDSKTKNRENTLKIRFVWKKRTDFRSRMRLRAFIQLILEEIGKKSSGSVTIVFLGEEDLLRINKEYLNHDYHTDIITFDYECRKKGCVEAELYISIDRVAENAKELNVTKKEEMHRVIFHGLLHLCRYNDKSEEEKEEMQRMEDMLLSRYFGFISRKTVSW